MAHQAHNFTLDTATQLKDAGLVAATTAGQVGGAAAYFDVGAANSYARFAIVIDWTACEVATGDESYAINVEGAEATAFSTAYRLASRIFGDSSVNGQPVDTPPSGRVVLFGDNVAITSATDGNSIICARYVRVRCVVAGTVATGFNYTAWLVPLQ